MQKIQQQATIQSQRTIITPKLKPLEIQDLQTAIPVPFKLENQCLVLERSLRSWKFQDPVKVPVEQVRSIGDKQLVRYIIEAFASIRPKLIPFVIENKSLLRVARHFLYRCSGSPKSLYNYAESTSLYSRYLGHSPDMIINDVLVTDGNIPDPVKVLNHVGLVQDYSERLQADGLSPGRVHGIIKEVRTFYRVNGIDLKLQHTLSRRVKYRDRAPTPEELTKMLEVADLRERTIVTLAALGGFREDTLTKLQYRHVKGDLEANRIPIHVFVESEIVKGKYGDYDTFLRAEAVEYLRLYIDDRRKGSGDGRRPPEHITDESPLIRSLSNRTVALSISTKQIRKIVHDLYRKAGLLKSAGGRMYELREHSLRKYFKTQLISRGVPESHADYMMGHVTDTYNDVHSLGLEKLRQAYEASGLSIRPQTRTSKIELIKEMIRSVGEDPEKILARDALTNPAITHLNPENYQDHFLQVLYQHLKEAVIRETTKQTQPT